MLFIIEFTRSKLKLLGKQSQKYQNLKKLHHEALYGFTKMETLGWVTIQGLNVDAVATNTVL